MQWPCPEGRAGGTERLFSDARFATPSGRARFHAVAPGAPAESCSEAFPLLLVTGRVKDQWHTRTRTGKVAKLNRSEPAPFVEVHNDDARLLRLRDRQLVRVTSRRGSVDLRARLTTAIRPGTVFAPFHWGALWDERTVANRATSDAVDPRSKQPALKFAAVRLEPL